MKALRVLHRFLVIFLCLQNKLLHLIRDKDNQRYPINGSDSALLYMGLVQDIENKVYM